MKMRLIRDGARSAVSNMAIDEMLLLGQGRKLPTLRIYSWSSMACSIGYFQDTKKVAVKLGAAKNGTTIVRRITGGGLVMHGSDVTLSLALPGSWLSGDVKSSYLKVNEALRVGFKELWPALDYADCKTVPSGRGQGDRICFEAPACYDLLLGSRKVVGASQRRMDGAVLHQSAVFLPADAKTVARKAIDGFEKNWGVSFEEIPLTEEELCDAGEIERVRYASEEWAIPAVS
jgi:lipoate-protein ligase A